MTAAHWPAVLVFLLPRVVLIVAVAAAVIFFVS